MDAGTNYHLEMSSPPPQTVPPRCDTQPLSHAKTEAVEIPLLESVLGEMKGGQEAAENEDVWETTMWGSLQLCSEEFSIHVKASHWRSRRESLAGFAGE